MHSTVRAALVATLTMFTLAAPLTAQRITVSIPSFTGTAGRQHASLGLPVSVTVSNTAPTAAARSSRVSGIGVDSIEVRSRLALADHTPYVVRLRDASGGTTETVAITAPNGSGRNDTMGRIRSDGPAMVGAVRTTNLILRLASPRGARSAVTCEISAIRVDI